MKKKKIITILIVLILVFIIYKTWFPTPQRAIYSGESENWRVDNLRLSTRDKKIICDEGSLRMKGKSKFLADYIHVFGYAPQKDVTEGHNTEKDAFLFGYELDGVRLPASWWKKDELDIVEMPAGGCEFIYLKKYDIPISLSDFREVYLIVKWKGKNDNDLKEEKVILNPTYR